jgi:hypothetical protein
LDAAAATDAVTLVAPAAVNNTAAGNSTAALTITTTTAGTTIGRRVLRLRLLLLARLQLLGSRRPLPRLLRCLNIRLSLTDVTAVTILLATINLADLRHAATANDPNIRPTGVTHTATMLIHPTTVRSVLPAVAPPLNIAGRLARGGHHPSILLAAIRTRRPDGLARGSHNRSTLAVHTAAATVLGALPAMIAVANNAAPATATHAATTLRPTTVLTTAANSTTIGRLEPPRLLLRLPARLLLLLPARAATNCEGLGLALAAAAAVTILLATVNLAALRHAATAKDHAFHYVGAGITAALVATADTTTAAGLGLALAPVLAAAVRAAALSGRMCAFGHGSRSVPRLLRR